MVKIDAISIKNISKKYKNKNIFQNVSLKFKTKGMTFISGKSGSGKTSLLNIIGNIDKNYQGEICFLSQFKNICNNTKTNRKFKKVNVDYVFQDYNLLENLTIEQNLKLALNIKGNNISTSEIVDKMALLGLEANFKKKLVKNLSGGERQRIAILRSLLRNSDIILADEPTGNVDEKNSEIIFNNLKILSQHKPIIVVSHDLDAAKKYADRIIEISDGIVISINENKSQVSNLNLKKYGDNFVQKQKSIHNFINYFRPLLFLPFKDFRRKIFQTILMIFTLTFTFLSTGLFFHLANLNKTINRDISVRLLQTDRVTAELLTNKEKQKDISIVNDTKVGIAKIIPLYFSSFGNGNLSYKGANYSSVLSYENFQVVDSSDFFKNRFSPLIEGEWIKNANEIILSQRAIEELKINNPIGKTISFKSHNFHNKESFLKIVGINKKGFKKKAKNANFSTSYIHQNFANKISKEFYLSNFVVNSSHFLEPKSTLYGIKGLDVELFTYKDSLKLINTKKHKSVKPNNKYEFLLPNSLKKIFEDLTNKSIFDIEFSYFFQDKTPLKAVGLIDDSDENIPNRHYIVMNQKDINDHKKLKKTYADIYLKNPTDLSKFTKELNNIHKDKLKLDSNQTQLLKEAKLLFSENNNVFKLSIYILILISLLFIIIFSLSLPFSKRKSVGILKVLKVHFGLSLLYHSFTMIFILLLSFALTLLLYFPLNILIGAFVEQFQIIGTNHISQINFLLTLWSILTFIALILYIGFSLLIYLQNSTRLLKLNEQN